MHSTPRGQLAVISPVHRCLCREFMTRMSRAAKTVQSIEARQYVQAYVSRIWHCFVRFHESIFGRPVLSCVSSSLALYRSALAGCLTTVLSSSALLLRVGRAHRGCLSLAARPRGASALLPPSLLVIIRSRSAPRLLVRSIAAFCALDGTWRHQRLVLACL